jgi:hypothetical protein
MKVTWLIRATVLVWGLVCLGEAHAYIDPGAGSYIFQLLIAFFIGSAFIIKSFWRNICGFFRKLFGRGDNDEDDDDD